MKKPILSYHYNRLLALFYKLHSRLTKKILTGRFKELSKRKQYHLVQRLEKLKLQLSRIENNFKYGGIALATATGLSLLSTNTMGQAAPVGSEFLVNTFTTSAQNAQDIAVDADGDFVVTWSSRGQDEGSEYGIYAQRFNAQGVATGAEFRVNTYVVGRQNNPAIAMADNGDFIIVWVSSGQDGSTGGIYAQRFKASGQAEGSEFQVNTTTTGNQYSPDVAMDSDGDFVITWSSAQDPSYGIYARRYNAAGAALSGEFLVNTTSAGIQRFSSIAMDNDGDFVIVWPSNGQDGDSYGIYGQRFNSIGTKQGGEMPINSTTAGSQSAPVVAMDGDGDFVVAWQSSDGTSDGIYAKRFRANGTAFGSESLVNTYTTNAQRNPYLGMDDDGNFIVVWESNGQDGNNNGIYAQQFNNSGAAIGSEFRVNTYTTDAQASASVAMDNDKDFIIAWTSNGQDGSGQGIYAQRYEENLAPTAIALSNNVVTENATANTTVGTLSTSDPDQGNTFTYSLVAGTGATDNASFAISGDQLQIAISPNFEVKNSYSIRVRSTDQGGATFEQTFTIGITNVNEAPTNIALSSTSLAENVTAGTEVGTLSTTDADASNTFTYSLVAGTGATNNASFSIAGDKLQINLSPNFEVKNSYSIRVRSTDQDGLSFEKVFTITITNVNEAPTNIALSSASVAENVASATEVGTLSTTDVDAANTFTYSLVAGTGSTDNASFTIVGDKLQINASPDFETMSTYSIRVRSTDQDGLTFEKAFTIKITNANEAPTNITLSSTSVAENVASATEVGTLSSTDVDAASTFTYSLVTGTGSVDNASFTIVGDKLQINASPDFETKSSYSIRVHSTDQDGLTFEKAFTITITNVNEAPTDIALSTTTVAENVAIDTEVGTLSTTDADASNTFTYSLVTGTGDNDNASFEIAGDKLLIKISPDFETKSSYSIRVRSTDQDGLTFEKAVTVSITDENETPSDITLSTTTVSENVIANTEVGTFSTTDPDASNTFTYALATGTGDDDNASFVIVGDKLQIVESPDFETKSSYTIRVSSTDQDGLSFEKTFTITITDEVETGITETNTFSSSIELYPNPAKGMAMTNLDGDVSVRILDLSGHLVKESKVYNKVITIDELPSGIYMLEFTQNGKIGFKKLVIE